MFSCKLWPTSSQVIALPAPSDHTPVSNHFYLQPAPSTSPQQLTNSTLSGLASTQPTSPMKETLFQTAVATSNRKKLETLYILAHISPSRLQHLAPPPLPPSSMLCGFRDVNQSNKEQHWKGERGCGEQTRL